MKKIILLSIVLIFVLGGAAGAYWWISRPQVITFSDDTTLTLLGADYGKKHTLPGGKLPPAKPRTTAQGAARVVQTTRTFNTVADTLVVWVRPKIDPDSGTPNQYRSFQFYIYDKAGTASAEAYANFQPGAQFFSVQFPAFPRRQGKFFVRVQEQGNSGQEMSEQKFVINNPAASKSYPNWTPEPLPVTKEDDGLSVSLTKLVAGADLPYQRVQDDPDGVLNKGVQLAYHVERSGKTVKNWSPASVEITDATGNRTIVSYGQGGNQAQQNGDEATMILQNGLWPDEPAWKLRMEMTQTADFNSDEQWTAQNIPATPGSQQSFQQNFNGLNGARGNPAGRGNPPAAPTPFAEGDLNGHHIKIYPVVQFTNTQQNLPANYVQPQQAGLMIQIQPAVINYVGRPVNAVNAGQPADDGVRMSLGKVTDGQGGDIQSYNSGTSTSGTGTPDSISTYRYTLRDTGGVTNINVSVSLHKNRFFEFTVKPESASAEK